MDAPLHALKSPEPPQARSMQRMGMRTPDKEPRADSEPRPVRSGVGGVRAYKAEGVTLYLADNREVRDLLAADALISDPPYGMDWDTDSTRFSGGKSENIRRKPRGEGRADYGDIAHDKEPFDPVPWLDYPRVVLWGANHYAERLAVGTTLVWIKKDEHLWGTFLSDAEVAWMKGGHGVYVFRKSFPPPVRAVDAGGDPCRPVGIHPTQKPVSLMAWCMDRAKVPAGALVCDPYAGSGTTAIACLRTGRRFVGAEKDAKYFETAVARIERELSQRDLFLGGGGAEQVGSAALTNQSGASSHTIVLSNQESPK